MESGLVLVHRRRRRFTREAARGDFRIVALRGYTLHLFFTSALLVFSRLSAQLTPRALPRLLAATAAMMIEPVMISRT